MYLVYILQSIHYKRYYVGHTEDIKDRLKRHNGGQVKSTKPYKPWSVVYTEMYESKSETVKREMEIKRYKGGIQFKNLINLRRVG